MNIQRRDFLKQAAAALAGAIPAGKIIAAAAPSMTVAPNPWAPVLYSTDDMVVSAPRASGKSTCAVDLCMRHAIH